MRFNLSNTNNTNKDTRKRKIDLNAILNKRPIEKSRSDVQNFCISEYKILNKNTSNNILQIMKKSYKEYEKTTNSCILEFLKQRRTQNIVNNDNSEILIADVTMWLQAANLRNGSLGSIAFMTKKKNDNLKIELIPSNTCFQEIVSTIESERKFKELIMKVL
uniref:Uncharacterized protein n=1 Tax=Strongyloides venezuelensis TaxID=75913 RepID=A0A0K0FQ49_STRVS